MKAGETVQPESSQPTQAPADPQDTGGDFAEQPAAEAEASFAPPTPGDEGITWRASEYVSHQKGASWFLALFLAIVVGAGGIYLFTRDLVSTAVIAVIGISFGIFAMRQPEVLDYAVDRTGLYIGEKFYAYRAFRSFSVLEEDSFHSIMLMPQQRFGLPIVVYYAPADESKIVEVIGSHLPHEERAVPPIDRLMSKIHF